MSYPSDLSDEQWLLIEGDVVRKKRCGPKSPVNLRNVVNAIFYRLRTGCQWDYLPKEYERSSVVKGYWRRWQANGLWERLNDKLRTKLREMVGRNAQPSAAIIDSQSVKTVQKGGVVDMMLVRKLRVASGI